MNTKKNPKCKVKTSWFSKLGPDGEQLRTYLQTVRDSDTLVECILCKVKLSCESKGYQAISQHLNSTKHSNALNANKMQLKITSIDTSSSEKKSTNNSSASDSDTSKKSLQLKLTDPRDEATAAEIIWTMKVVSSNFSANSCNDLSETFRHMFPNNPTCSEFSLARSKLSYMITDSVGPYLRNIFLSDVKDKKYTLCFDETTNDASKKELHTSVRYFSEKNKRIQQHHLQTFFIENGKGVTIAKYLDEALLNAKLSLQDMLTLGRDGPNVNKTVFNLMQEKFKEKTGKKLIDIGPCDIHVIHNAYKKGLDTFGSHVANLMVNIHYFFDGEALRSQEYRDVQTKLNMAHHRFIKHVSSRWLTLLDSISRFYDEWEAVHEYFNVFIPKKRPVVMESTTYKTVIRHLKSESLKGKNEFQFLSNYY